MEDWWLKVQRAEKHMEDINQAAMRYAESKPYNFTRIRLPDSKKQIGGRFRITEQPDPMIAVMLGDFVHNLRTALDYVVVACVPKQRRKNASFPILFQDIFAKDKNGEFVIKDAQLRENFETSTKGLHPKARALIISLQPYNLSLFGQKVDPNVITLGILSRLGNADKHRQLITLGCAGKDFVVSFNVRGLAVPIQLEKLLATGEQFLKDNAVISYNIDLDGIPHPDGSFVRYSDVEMQLTGTAKILVKVPKVGGNQSPDDFLLDTLMDSMMFEVRGILKKLEFFVCST